MQKSETGLQAWQIAKINLKHNFIPNLALAVCVLLLAPILFGTVNLDQSASAVPLEYLVSLIGIILLAPVFQPEANPALEELMRSKNVNSLFVVLIRVIYSAVSIAILVLLFGLYMRANGCEVTPELMIGTAANALFLGSLGVMAAAAVNIAVTAYMVPVLYYLLNYAAGRKFGIFSLFSMTDGEAGGKIWLLALGVCLLIAAFTLRVWKRRLS